MYVLQNHGDFNCLVNENTFVVEGWIPIVQEHIGRVIAVDHEFSMLYGCVQCFKLRLRSRRDP